MAIASTLTERAFAERRQPDWEELETLANTAHQRGTSKLNASGIARLPSLYRNVCADLAAAEAARYSAPLVAYLRGLTASAHGVLYGKHAGTTRAASGEVGVRSAWFSLFPRAVRARKRAMLLALGLFFVPMMFGAIMSLRDPTFAFRVVPEAMLRPLTEAYAKGFEGGRDTGSDSLMAGFYVYNNVGIALRCFALGIFGGLGSAFYLLHNGLSIGATLGYVAAHGAGANIGIFILGHGSLELGAIVLAGGSGLSLGWSIVAPGEHTRLQSLQRSAREIVVIVGGAAVMLVMAAMIEGFWSASSVPNVVKMTFGGAVFVLLVLYIAFVGRGAPPSSTR